MSYFFIRNKCSEAYKVVHDKDNKTLVKHLQFISILVLERSLQTNQDDGCDAGHRQDEILNDEILLKHEDADQNQQSFVVVK